MRWGKFKGMVRLNTRSPLQLCYGHSPNQHTVVSLLSCSVSSKTRDLKNIMSNGFIGVVMGYSKVFLPTSVKIEESGAKIAIFRSRGHEMITSSFLPRYCSFWSSTFVLYGRVSAKIDRTTHRAEHETESTKFCCRNRRSFGLRSRGTTGPMCPA